MPEITDYAPGTPSWADLASTDIPAAIAFYRGLFGWEAADQGPEGGGYHMFLKDGKAVAGLGPQMQEGMPPNWASYVTVASVDDTVAAVREGGGMVFLEPMDVLDAGRMAVCADPTGVAFSLWEPRMHRGAQLTNEPGAQCWNELNTRDPEAAGAFYAAVFGWELKQSEGPMGGYVELVLDGRSIAGMIDMRGRVPDDIPAHWLVYFGVADVDEATTTAKELGGSVFVGPLDIPDMGRFAVIGDDHGAFFGAFEFAGGG